MTFSVCGECYELGKGDIGFASTGDIHGIIRADDTRLIVQFDLEILENKFFGIADTKAIQDKLNRLERVSLHWPADVRNNIVKILLALGKVEEDPDHGTGYRIKVRRLLYQLIEICFGQIPESGIRVEENPLLENKKVMEELDSVFHYVRERYSENIGLEDAAALLNYSLNYFTKFWKRYTGGTFHAYLNEYRISKAISLLVDTNLPIGEIGFKVGFQSQKTFNRAFKSITGKTPCDYRR